MRLFVALNIPDDIRQALDTVVRTLRTACPDARWARIDGLHVTLKFIGETPGDKLEPIKAALANVRAAAPIALQFRGTGFFPDARRPRVLWAGIEAGPELTELAASVENSLAALGIPRETRVFSPHLTLARFDRPRGLAALHSAIEAAGPLEFGATVAKEFHLYQSVLKRGGAEYTRLATFSFVGSTSQ